jgi:hypothetical protein
MSVLDSAQQANRAENTCMQAYIVDDFPWWIFIVTL